MTREQWEEAGRMCALREQKSLWEIAWWLVEGDARGYDPGFASAQVILQRERTTIENYYRVGRAWPRGTPHPDLSFSTHKELLREPDVARRAEVLSLAIEGRWFASDVARHFDQHPPSVRALVGVDRPPGATNRAPYERKYYNSHLAVHVKCPCGCGHVFPIKGNKVTRDGQPTSASDSRGGQAFGPAARPLSDSEASALSAPPATSGDA